MVLHPVPRTLHLVAFPAPSDCGEVIKKIYVISYTPTLVGDTSFPDLDICRIYIFYEKLCFFDIAYLIPYTSS